MYITIPSVLNCYVHVNPRRKREIKNNPGYKKKTNKLFLFRQFCTIKKISSCRCCR